jgi:hypothetical protein
VGEISFWAPNRGLLITGGTEPQGPVASGLYAYDGVSWHQLATVCGGPEGRIAWAGPDEFWTIADQRPGQILPPGGSHSLQSLSLCHFLDGQVVGSYAVPLEEPGSYLHMDAAACYGPSDCWFGGDDGRPPNVGAFHLHWDGSAVSAVYEPEDHAVTDMVNFAGQIYESVQIGESDAWLPTEKPKHPAILHTIFPAGQVSLCDRVESAFCPHPIFLEGEPLPRYGEGMLPDALQGFSLGTDGSPLGAGATQLWAAANTHFSQGSPSLTVLRYANGAWSQVLSAGHESPLPARAMLAGTNTQMNGYGGERGTSGAIAPEPGGEGAWLSLMRGGGVGVEVALLRPDGTLAERKVLPEEGEQVGFRGEAGPIACPAAHDCWLATSSAKNPVTEQVTVPGWLFHFTDGSQYPQNTDPLFDGEDPVIAFRPPDEGVPVIYPDVPPVDNSLANQQPPPPPTGAAEQVPSSSTGSKRSKPLVTHVKSRFLHRRVLVISFTLTARAHVQLIGRRRREVVARTRREALRPGRHQLSLSLDPKRWPTKLQLKATPIGALAPASGSESSGSEGAGPNSVGT